MEPIMCNEDGCENIIYPDQMTYGRDYWVLINLMEADRGMSSQEILNDGLVDVFCRDCGIIRMAEAQANGFIVVSRRD